MSAVAIQAVLLPLFPVKTADVQFYIIACMMTTQGREEESADFRKYLPDLSIPRFVTAKSQNPYEYSKFFQDNQAPPWLFALTKAWEKLLEEPFKGVTSTGKSYHFAKA